MRKKQKQFIIKDLDSHQGLPGRTPVKSLHIEANESPLSLRRQKLALQYFTKLSSYPSNPAMTMHLKTHQKTLFGENLNAIKPFTVRVRNLISEMKMDFSSMHQSIISKTPPSRLNQPSFILDLAKMFKEQNKTNYNSGCI